MLAVSSITPGNIIAATGLALEARVAAGPGIVTVCSGGCRNRLGSQLQEAGSRPVRAVLSFGFAGGLDPRLRAGDIIIATELTHAGTSWPVDARIGAMLATRLERGGRTPFRGCVAGSDHLVADPSAKAALHGTGAAAVDMESHVAAEFAQARGLPFAVVRVICDPADRALPALVRHAIGAHGRIDATAILQSLAGEPAQVSALFGIGRDFATAFAVLRRSRRLLGPRFGLADTSELLLDVT